MLTEDVFVMHVITYYICFTALMPRRCKQRRSVRLVACVNKIRLSRESNLWSPVEDDVVGEVEVPGSNTGQSR